MLRVRFAAVQYRSGLAGGLARIYTHADAEPARAAAARRALVSVRAVGSRLRADGRGWPTGRPSALRVVMSARQQVFALGSHP
jgi:hypothetical protein